MVLPGTVVSIVLSFLFVLVCLPYWIRRSLQHDLVILDAQKFPAKRVAYLGGIVVVFGAVVGVLFYVAAHTFLYNNEGNLTVLLAGVCSILGALVIGVVDDLLGERIGLRQYQKPILCLFASLPLVVVNAGVSLMYVPFFGPVAFGLLYPFLLVPVGVSGAANGFNILAGVNGLEAGLGVIILTTLGFVCWVSGSSAGAIVAFCMVAAILPFLFFNWFPARILPGNGFTYAVGASIAVVAIVGNVERSALILFIPYFFECFLKLRGLFQKESLARVLPDGSLVNQYSKWYSLNHVVIGFLRSIKGRALEWEVAMVLCSVELFLAGIVFVITFL